MTTQTFIPSVAPIPAAHAPIPITAALCCDEPCCDPACCGGPCCSGAIGLVDAPIDRAAKADWDCC